MTRSLLPEGAIGRTGADHLAEEHHRWAAQRKDAGRHDKIVRDLDQIRR